MSLFDFFKQKTAYEMRISDWSSDVCSSDLSRRFSRGRRGCAWRFRLVMDAPRWGRNGQAHPSHGQGAAANARFATGHTHSALACPASEPADRRSEGVEQGKSVPDRVNIGGRRIFKKKKQYI